LLWLNIVTDGLAGPGARVDAKIPGILERPPRPVTEPVINHHVIRSVAFIGIAMLIAGLPLFFYALDAGFSVIRAQTLLLTFIVLAEMAALQVIRARYRQSIWSNRWLIAVVASSIVLQLIVVYTALNGPFGYRSRMLLAGNRA
jgi:Ca2+-transporting ATPase